MLRLTLFSALGGFVLMSCGASDRPDLLLITIDTLRQDHVSAYGRAPGLTPNLDELAARGALFERHYATGPQTGPSVATMLTGLYASEHGLRRNGDVLGPEHRNLPEQLDEQGYHCVAVSGSGVVTSPFGFDRGFQEFDEDYELVGRKQRPRAYRPATEVIDASIEFAERRGRKPLFLWVHLIDPHEPYSRPLTEHLSRATIESAFGHVLQPSEFHSRDDLLEHFAKYAADVSYADRELGRLLDTWYARERDSVIAVTADHGESLGEHGYIGHSLYLYEEQLLVPLILTGAEVPAGTRVPSVTSMIDLPGTLLDALSAENSGDDRLGRSASLLPLARGQTPSTQPLAFAERAAWTRGRPAAEGSPTQRLLWSRRGRSGGQLSALRCAISASAKRIEADAETSEMYDLSADATERSPLLESRASEQQPGLEQALAAWRDSLHSSGASRTTDSAPLNEMLDALGYGEFD